MRPCDWPGISPARPRTPFRPVNFVAPVSRLADGACPFLAAAETAILAQLLPPCPNLFRRCPEPNGVGWKRPFFA